jgi:hypothetical protein
MDRVEFVITHEADRFAGFAHPLCGPHNLDILWPSVDQVSEEERLTAHGMPPDTGAVFIAQNLKSMDKRSGVAVDVAEDVNATGVLEDVDFKVSFLGAD